MAFTLDYLQYGDAEAAVKAATGNRHTAEKEFEKLPEGVLVSYTDYNWKLTRPKILGIRMKNKTLSRDAVRKLAKEHGHAT